MKNINLGSFLRERGSINLLIGSLYLCTWDPLSKQEANLLRQMSHDLYQTNMILDDLPVLRFINNGHVQFKFMGFPLGYSTIPLGGTFDNNYIVNHLKFRISVRPLSLGSSQLMEIVRFEVVPCSIKHDHQAMSELQMYDGIIINHPVSCTPGLEHEPQLIGENETVSFTYQVEFVQRNDLTWSSRWNAYLEDELEEYRWSSILNSVITISLLAGCLFFKVSRNSELKEDRMPLVTRGVPRWWKYHHDVVKEPSCSSVLFCAMVGNGIQLATTGVVTTTFAALGQMSPGSQQTLMIITVVSIVCYILSGFPAGYASVWLWRRFKEGGNSDGWKSVAWSVSCLFNATIFIIFMVMNKIHAANGSTGAVPWSVYWTLLSLWFCLSLPCTFTGGFMAAARPSSYHNPAGLVQQVQQPRRTIRTWLIVLLAGLVPFGIVFVELFFFLRSIWLVRLYNAHNLPLLLLVLLMLMSACGLVSTFIADRCACNEDRGWRWKAFFASGLTGLYAFLYSMNFLAIDLRWLNGPSSGALFLCYSLILGLCLMLSTGAIGTLAAFSFLRYL
ncbi:hypothetical protein J5N97_006638 [Dioscorea zingiberensis]|uniref:Transmembrane 9 superfamily member n=1 Tax=Dioscorea zingiberensis TaxID=325984 RepID=A0A9D5DDK0_9LILI|nr:hypothetical protein J5N97_006638 [Dioscorea zingiberensis]